MTPILTDLCGGGDSKRVLNPDPGILSKCSGSPDHWFFLVVFNLYVHIILR